MTVKWLTPTPKQQFFDSDSLELSAGKLFIYSGGTTTKATTWTESTGTTANANPIILTGRGEADIWLTPGVAYKFVLSPSTDTDPPTHAIWTVDNIMVQLPIYWPKVPPGGTPANSAFIWGDYIVGTVNFPANFAGSRFYAKVAPTLTYVITVTQNGATIGTITFSAMSNVAVLATSAGAAIGLLDGDRFELVGQALADATISGIYGTFKGTRLF